MNKQTALLIALTSIASANKEGYTVDAKTLKPVTTGYAVAVKDTQNSFGPEGLANVIRYIENHKNVNAFGGWYDSESDLYYYDATIIVDDLDKALELGRANDQLAIFDLTNCKEIRL